MRKRLIFSASNEQTKTAPQVLAEASVLDISPAVPASGSDRGVESHNRHSGASINNIKTKSGA